MADQTAPFGQDVTLTRCGFSREGYEFAGWAESSYGTEVKYLDGAVINRPFEEGDYWDDGSEDGETYNLYAIWTENKSPEQKEAEEKLAAAEEAIWNGWTEADRDAYLRLSRQYLEDLRARVEALRGPQNGGRA